MRQGKQYALAVDGVQKAPCAVSMSDLSGRSDQTQLFATGRVILASATLFALACFGNEVWRSLSNAFGLHFQADELGAEYFTAWKASVFLVALVVLAWPYAADVVRAISEKIERSDLRYALLATFVLAALSFVMRASSLGANYQEISLAPFSQDTSGLHRRVLEVALAYYTHLNGGLFIALHFAIAIFLLMMLRLVFRQQGISLSVLELASIGTASFVFHNFQYPGYPDALVVLSALVLLSVEMPSHGRAALMALALLAHEALAAAVLLPLSLLLPRRDRLFMLSVCALYGLFWAADFGFDVTTGFQHQVSYFGHSGPELLRSRPLVVLAGIVVAFKLLWLPMGAHFFGRLRIGVAGALREFAPIAAALGLCVISYDTSRMAGMCFPVLLTALPALWNRFGQRGRAAFFIANLLLPSPYISPIVDTPLGTVWTPGLYAAYNGFEFHGRLLPPSE